MIQTYIVLILSIIIFVTIIVIASKAISQGIAAKRKNSNKEVEGEDILKEEENHKEELENLSLSNELEKINELYKDGLLTEEEFTKAKNKILD